MQSPNLWSFAPSCFGAGLRWLKTAVPALFALSLVWSQPGAASVFTVGVFNGFPVPPGAQVSSSTPLAVSDIFGASNPALGSGVGIASASAEPGMLRGLLDLTVTGTSFQFEADVTASFFASMLIDDIIISGPSNFVLTSLFIDVDGAISTNNIATGRAFNASASLTGPTSTSGGANVTTPVATVASADSISTRLTTEATAFAVGVPLSALVTLRGQASVRDIGTTPGSINLLADFANTVQFAGSGPVFDLPVGFTVDSLSGGIVDNRFVGLSTVPEPPAALLFAIGLAGLVGFTRRRVGRTKVNGPRPPYFPAAPD